MTMNKIQSIIDQYFDIDFFWGKDSSKMAMVRALAEAFESKYGFIFKRVLDQLRSRYPDVTIRRYTYFIEEDRCLTFELIRPGHDSVIIALSIFDYFVTWALKTNSEGFYIDYIEEGEDPWVDSIFHTIVNPEMDASLTWATRELLFMEIEQFNIDHFRGIGDSPIYVANLLTRFHSVI